ncbi:MAG: zinc-ribbon domain-containing protein [Firmicutes bacterium]|nr:zinc-ribbon domain-containing protein [Bacillota bacterium]
MRPAGARAAEAGAADTRPAEAAGPKPAAVRCAVCGAEAEPGAKFCLGCGRILR